MSHSYSGYTGHLFEEEVIGRCRVTHNGHMRWREAMELVRKNQPAALPITARRLRNRVAERIGDTVGTLKFFTAVGTPLDFFHGVDGFFEFKGVVVTIDVTMNPHKDSGKADIIVQKDDLNDIPELAGRIAREMRSQLSRRVY